MKQYKFIVVQFLINILSIWFWESFLRKTISEMKIWMVPLMEYAQISNPWFIIFFLSVNILFASIIIRKQKLKLTPITEPSIRPIADDVPKKQKLLDRLENLTDDPCFKPNNIYFNKNACVKWANTVAPLLKGGVHYNDFVHYKDALFTTNDVLGEMPMILERMQNILDAAIKGIKGGINNKNT